MEIHAETGDVRCCHDRVRQVLADLVQNAVKFTPTGGVIGLSPRSELTEWAFSVEDLGHCAASDKIAHASTASGRAAARTPGTGLNLSIAKGARRAARREDLSGARGQRGLDVLLQGSATGLSKGEQGSNQLPLSDAEQFSFTSLVVIKYQQLDLIENRLKEE